MDCTLGSCSTGSCITPLTGFSLDYFGLAEYKQEMESGEKEGRRKNNHEGGGQRGHQYLHLISS